jgi:hypothetical protein
VLCLHPQIPTTIHLILQEFVRFSYECWSETKKEIDATNNHIFVVCANSIKDFDSGKLKNGEDGGHLQSSLIFILSAIT